MMCRGNGRLDVGILRLDLVNLLCRKSEDLIAQVLGQGECALVLELGSLSDRFQLGRAGSGMNLVDCNFEIIDYGGEPLSAGTIQQRRRLKDAEKPYLVDALSDTERGTLDLLVNSLCCNTACLIASALQVFEDIFGRCLEGIRIARLHDVETLIRKAVCADDEWCDRLLKGLGVSKGSFGNALSGGI